ncbi:MAG: hypothetical protein ACAH88_19115 [Roseimicrobium sp.]
MSATHQAVIDEEQLFLCLTGDQEIDLDLLHLAMSQCDEALAAMENALRASDDATWLQAAHRARGFTGTMGFARAAFLWNIAEFEATTPEARAQSMAALRSSVEEVRAELRARGYAIPDAAMP